MGSERDARPQRGTRACTVVCVLAAILAVPGCALLRPTPPKPPDIAVVLSEDTPAYTEVAHELARKYKGGIQTYRLRGNGLSPELQQRLQASDNTIVVAVGVESARRMSQLSSRRAIYCQVFNYEDARLPASGMRGVSATPPVSEQFRYWKLLSPRLRSVGVVTGPGLSTLLTEARAAADEHHIRLLHAVARTDKGMLFAYKQMAPKVEGFWLLPDNRILSRASVRELLAFSVKRGKQVLVFTPELLASGGLLSAESRPEDVAERVLSVVSARDAGDVPVVPLTQARIRINSVVANLLNLQLPPELRELAYAP